MDLKAILEAEFGFCIRRAGERLRLEPKLALLEVLHDEKKILALPYLLDQDPYTL